MHTDRSAILSLVATGRITPHEAERLLVASRDADDTILRLALCLAFAGFFVPYVGNAVISIAQTLATYLPAVERALVAFAGMA
jgi:hypothetical protein